MKLILAIFLCGIFSINTYTSAFCWNNNDVENLIKTEGDIISAIGYSFVCLYQYDSSLENKFDAEKLGQELTSILELSLIESQFIPIMINNGIELANQENCSRCPIMTGVTYLFLDKNSKNKDAIRVFEKVAKYYNSKPSQKKYNKNSIGLKDKNKETTQATDVNDFNINDTGYVLGYASQCSNNPDETSQKYIDWYFEEFGMKNIESFDKSFQEGFSRYNKDNGSNCNVVINEVKKLGIE